MNGYKEMSNRRYTCIFGLNPTAILYPKGHSDFNKCVQSLQANDELPQEGEVGGGYRAVEVVRPLWCSV